MNPQDGLHGDAATSCPRGAKIGGRAAAPRVPTFSARAEAVGRWRNTLPALRRHTAHATHSSAPPTAFPRRKVRAPDGAAALPPFLWCLADARKRRRSPSYDLRIMVSEVNKNVASRLPPAAGREWHWLTSHTISTVRMQDGNAEARLGLRGLVRALWRERTCPRGAEPPCAAGGSLFAGQSRSLLSRLVWDCKEEACR